MTDQFIRAEYEQWRTLMSGLPFPAYEGVSAGLAAEIADHNERVSRNKGRIDSAFKTIDEALANVDAGEFGDFYTALGQSQADRGAMIQEIAKLYANRESLADKAGTEFKAQLAPAEAEFNMAREKARVDFTAMGSGVNAMPAYGVDGATAEAQLDFLVLNRNVHTRKAGAAVQDVRSRIDAAVQQKHASAEARKTVQKFVVRVARQLAGV